MNTRRILLVVISLGLAGCGQSGNVATPNNPSTQCSGNYNGTWNGNTGGEVTLTSTCGITISPTGGCTSVGTYQAMLGSFGTSYVTITSLSGTSPCLNLGQHPCSYVFAGAQFSLNCGSGDYVYYR